jgi:imidazoleglycerol-phosphate dehydratase
VTPRTTRAAREAGGDATSVAVDVELRGRGAVVGSTGVTPLDELLGLLAEGAQVDLTVRGDESLPPGPLAREVGVQLARAVEAAAPDGLRYGSTSVPSHEALAQVAVDRADGPYLALNVDLREQHVGGLDADVVGELWRGLASGGGWTLHARLHAGRDTGHVVRAVMIALGRALRRSWTES